MKKLFLVILFITIVAVNQNFSQTRSIRFIEKPWSEIIAQSKQEKKLIFLDAFASWCGPCKWMASTIFTNDSVGDFYNSRFICVSLDMEKGEGKEIRARYDVRYYPTLLFINQEGEVVHKRVGAARLPSDYITMANTALNPRENLAYYLKKYQEGDNSDTFIPSFLQRLTDAYLPVQPVIQKYFDSKTEVEMLSRPCWEIMKKYVNDMNESRFDYLIKHQHEYGKIYGKDSVNNKISEVYLAALMKQTRSAAPTDTVYKTLKRKIRESGFEGAEKVIFASDLNFFQMYRENQKFLDLAYDGLDKYYSDDFIVLNSVAKSVSDLCSGNTIPNPSKYLEKASGWSKKSISIKPEPTNNDNYASILFKLGRTKEAIKHEKTAISLAKKQNLPTKDYEDRLAKMENPATAGTKKP